MRIKSQKNSENYQGWIKRFLPQEQGFKMKIYSIKFMFSLMMYETQLKITITLILTHKDAGLGWIKCGSGEHPGEHRFQERQGKLLRTSSRCVDVSEM